MAIRVLVVDDSLFMRTLISDLLNADSELEVIDTAKSGSEALKKALKLKPDVITLDLVMPDWDGLTTLTHLMAEAPTPVVILSAHSRAGADITLRCLHAGAVGFVLKPSGELSLDIATVKARLIDQVKAAAKARVGKPNPPGGKRPQRTTRKAVRVKRIVLIGASTGGPQALETLLTDLPAEVPMPMIVLQHVPSACFTESLAERLQQRCALHVKVATDGERLQVGTVYLAPGGSRLTLESTRMTSDERRATNVLIRLSLEEPKHLSPSIDLTMQSAAQIYGAGTIGIILSGMGRDGLQGMQAIKAVGGATVAQDESSLIFGMPKAVIEASCADQVLPITEMAKGLLQAVENRSQRGDGREDDR